MTAEEAIRLTRLQVEGQFPKVCGKCARRFETLADYLRKTQHSGHPISYYEEKGEPEPSNPIGVMSFAKCICGATLAITSHGMSLVTLGRLAAWARGEGKRRGISFREVLAWVRSEIDRQVLAEHPPAPRPPRQA
jgi:hypothetical protein